MCLGTWGSACVYLGFSCHVPGRLGMACLYATNLGSWGVLAYKEKHVAHFGIPTCNRSILTVFKVIYFLTIVQPDAREGLDSI